MMEITEDNVGKKILLLANEAITRGAIEAGIDVATTYPGTPSSEIADTFSKIARNITKQNKKQSFYFEYSTNEKVALEIAAAASFSEIRALSAMKQNGLNVALDFLANVNLTGVNRGLVLAVCDDPGAISSTNEQDSRHVAKMLDLPLLEPATFQEAKDMTKWAFELSEEIKNVCLLRSVTRISHARGNVVLGELPMGEQRAHFDILKRPYASIVAATPPQLHQRLHQNIIRIREIYEQSSFNWYQGPEKPDLLIVTCGSGWFFSQEAVEILSKEDL